MPPVPNPLGVLQAEIAELTSKVDEFHKHPDFINSVHERPTFKLSRFLGETIFALVFCALLVGKAPSDLFGLSLALILTSIPYPSPDYSGTTSRFFYRLTLLFSLFIFCSFAVSSHPFHSATFSLAALDTAIRQLTIPKALNAFTFTYTLLFAQSLYYKSLRNALEVIVHNGILNNTLRTHSSFFTPAEKQLLSTVDTHHLYAIKLITELRVKSDLYKKQLQLHADSNKQN